MADEKEDPTVEFPPPALPPEPDLDSLLPPQVVVDVAGRSDVGKVRANNEDHFVVSRTGRVIDRLFSNLPPGGPTDHLAEYGYAFLVADGLGGMNAGEYASRLALQASGVSALQMPEWIFRVDRKTGPDVLRRLRRFFQAIDRTLLAYIEADPSLSGMATTLTLVYTLGADAFLGHVGDSRAYRLRKGRLVRLTTDHTIAQAMADAGQIPPESVTTHSHRNVLTNFVGGPTGGIKPQVIPFQIVDGDVLLVCSDGLTDMVDEATIVRRLAESADAESACQALIADALERGGRDNVTAIVARFTIPFDPGPPWFEGPDTEPTVDS